MIMWRPTGRLAKTLRYFSPLNPFHFFFLLKGKHTTLLAPLIHCLLKPREPQALLSACLLKSIELKLVSVSPTGNLLLTVLKRDCSCPLLLLHLAWCIKRGLMICRRGTGPPNPHISISLWIVFFSFTKLSYEICFYCALPQILLLGRRGINE